MSSGTIKAFEEKQKRKAEADRPAKFLGIHCPACKLTWIVCELPQQMRWMTEHMRRHQHCPECRGTDLELATVDQVRPLLKEGP